MSDTNLNTNLATGDVPTNRLLSFPLADGNPARNFLAFFGEWIEAHCVVAMFELRRLSRCAQEVNASAIYAARRQDVTPEKSLFRPLKNPVAAGHSAKEDARRMADFFFFHLECARHEHTLLVSDFFQQMQSEGVREEEFDADRQDQFEARFEAFLEAAPWHRASWQASGLSIDALIEEIFAGAIDAT